MTKKRSKSLFVLFSILLVVCLIACFVNFTYPFPLNGNYYSYSNFVANLKLGEDVSSSLRIVYRAEQNEDEISTNYNELRTSTMNGLKEIIAGEGYKDVTVAEYGLDGIVVTVGNLLTLEDKNNVASLIGNPATISFSTESDGSNPFAGAKHIKNVESMQYNNPETGEVSYVVVLEFKEEHHKEIAEKSSGKTVNIYLGETKFAELDYSGGAISDGIIYLQSSTFVSLLDATTCANQIKTGMLDLSLTQISSDYISASYGGYATILVTIAMVIVILVGFIFLILKYKHLGWLACFNLLFFIVLSLFFMQSIPLVYINLAGIIAMLISFVLAVDGLMIVFEKAKEHYQAGTQFFISFREAQKETLFRTLFLNALVLVSGFICLFIPVQAISSFGWIALITSIVSTFTNLVLMRLFVKMYLALNNEDGKKCNFQKGGKNA
ncbi:MAG: hypothetical protein J6Q13_00180 [Clostridia bacterium]|nr:hypothetical protein [Clostridia bacterium]